MPATSISPIPYGFKLADDGKTLIEVPEQQAIIALIRELHEGGENYSAIARTLNDRKIPTARGKAWHREGVARIVNPDARLRRKRRRKKRAC